MFQLRKFLPKQRVSRRNVVREWVMSEKIYAVSKAWAKRGYVNDAKYKKMYKASVADGEGFWREHGKRIDCSNPTPRSRTSPTSRARSRSNGSRMASPTSPTTVLTAISRSAPSRSPSSGKATIRVRRRSSPTSSFTTRFAVSPTCSRPRVSRRATASRSTCR